MRQRIVRRFARALTLAIVGITLVPGVAIVPTGFAPARAASTAIGAAADVRRYRTRRGGAAALASAIS